MEKNSEGIEPEFILNYDETEISDDTGREKILAKVFYHIFNEFSSHFRYF